MAIVGYARVSTSDQDLTVQLDALADAGVEKIFSEKKSGRSANHREELWRAIEYVREGDILICTRLDRLARSVTDLRFIVDKLEEKGVGFRCINQPFDTTTPEGRLMLNILGSFAEFETDIRRERQAEGIAKARLQGKYKRTKYQAEPKIDSTTIIRLRDEDGFGATAIAKAMGCNRSSIYRLVPNGWGEQHPNFVNTKD